MKKYYDQFGKPIKSKHHLTLGVCDKETLQFLPLNSEEAVPENWRRGLRHGQFQLSLVHFRRPGSFDVIAIRNERTKNWERVKRERKGVEPRYLCSRNLVFVTTAEYEAYQADLKAVEKKHRKIIEKKYGYYAPNQGRFVKTLADFNELDGEYED